MLYINFPYGLQAAGEAKEPTDQTICFPLMIWTDLLPSFPLSSSYWAASLILIM